MISRTNYFRILLLLAIALLAVSCTPLRQVAALLRSTDEFHPVGANVMVEELADTEFGLQIQSKIPAYIDSVQRKLGLTFTKPVKVYVCHSTKSFCSHTGSRHPGPRASVLGKFFVSPRLQGTADWESIVDHELVHLILKQHLGNYKYQKIPVWFHEGLATLIANGGGAGDVTDSTAIGCILEGKHFDPVDKENFVFLRSFENKDISIWTHYRQAMLFVGFMQAKSPQVFQSLLLDLASGTTFRQAVNSAYSEDVATLWQDYTNSLRNAHK